MSGGIIIFGKPFRFPKVPRGSLTTIIAVECKDALVMSADTQLTGQVREETNKIEQIGDNCLIGCSGSLEYISLFIEYVRRAHSAPNTDYYNMLNNAIHNYSTEINARTAVWPAVLRYRIPDCYPRAIFCAYDINQNRFRIFEMQTPHPCAEVSNLHRATVGSGSVVALAFLKTANDIMRRFSIEWTEQSWKLVAQGSWVLLRRISHIDSYTSGNIAYMLSKAGPPKQLYELEIFETKTPSHPVSMFLATALKEIGIGKILEIAMTYNLTTLSREILK